MLGAYLLAAAAALFATVNLHSGVQRMRVLDVRDALLDQQHLGEHFRMRGR
jgi:hypothetical protein